MRLGEILVNAGVISARELEVALARQRGNRARLGTVLVELAFVDADDVARGLARQHGVPAALARHLRDRDRGLTSYVPADLARELHALPVALSRGAQGVNLVVCFRDPEPEVIATVARVAGMQVVPAVACSHLLERELLRAYPAGAPFAQPPLGATLPPLATPARRSPAARPEDERTPPIVARTITTPTDAAGPPTSRTTTGPVAGGGSPAARTTTGPVAGGGSPAPRTTTGPIAGGGPPSPAVPRTTTGPQSSPAVPRTTTGPQSSPALPRTTSGPQSSPALPRTTTGPQSSPALPRTATGPQPSPAVPRTATGPQSSPVLPRTATGPAPGAIALVEPTPTPPPGAIVTVDAPVDLEATPAARRSAELTLEREDTGSFDIDLEEHVDEDPHGFGGLERLALVDLDDRRVVRDHSQTLQVPTRGGLPAAASPSGRYPAVSPDGVAAGRSPSGRYPAIDDEPPPPRQGGRYPAVDDEPPPPRQGGRYPAVVPEHTPPPRRGDHPVVTDEPPAPRQSGRHAAVVPEHTPPPPAGRQTETANAGRVTDPRAASSTPRAPGPVDGGLISTGLRDPVAERYLPLLVPAWRVAIVLAVEPGQLTPRAGVGASLTAASLEHLWISLDEPSILRSVVELRRPHVGDALDHRGAPREPWLRNLAGAAARELAIAPVNVGERVVRLLVAVGARIEIGAASGEVIRVARLITDAYARGDHHGH